MATETVNRQINIFIQSGEAQKVYDKLIAKEKELNKQLKETSDPTRIKKLNAELSKLQEPIDRAAKKLRGELAPSLKEQDALVKKLGASLRHMSRDDANFQPVLNQYKQAKIELAQMQVQIKNVEAAHANVAKTNPFGRMAEFAKGAFLGGAVLEIVRQGAQKIGDFIKDSLSEALEAEEIGARLNATLDNLGRSDAFDRIMDKADELAKRFKYLDNDDIVGVFNKLIDYGKLTEGQMNELLPVIIDFAAKQRISLSESSDVIVKALEGNSKALKLYGIDMKDVKDEGERLNVVMTTLKEKVEGAGEAFQQTTTGKLATARQEFANLKEEIGNSLIPALNGLMTWVNGALKGLPILATKIKNTFTDVADFLAYGPGKAMANIAERERANEDAAAVRNIEKNISAFSGKSSKDIYAEIDRLTPALRVKEDRLNDLTKRKASGEAFNEDALKELRQYELGVKQLKGTVEGLYKLLEKPPTTTLGIPGVDKENNKKSTSKTVDKTADDLKKLYETIAKMQQEAAQMNESELMKELARTRQQYDELETLAHGNKAALKDIEDAWHIEQQQIFEKYAKKELEKEQKLADDKKKIREKELQDQLRKGFGFVEGVAKDVAAQADAANRNRKAGIELEALQASGKKRLALELQLLDEEERQALAAKNLTENEKMLIEEQYRQKRQEAETNYFTNQAQLYLQFAQQVVGVLDAIGSAKTARENAELERDRKINERKKDNLDRQLKKGIISREEYDRKIEALDKKQEKKEHEIAVKQFKRAQRQQIVQAIMSGAQAVVSTLAARPGALDVISLAAFRAINIGLAVATTAAQVASIASQKPPEFARGGKLGGRSHSEGGNPILDGRTGRKIAEIEEDEGIINKRSMRDKSVYTVTGTPSQIASRINGIGGGVQWESGASLRPVWRTTPVQKMNFSAIQSTYSRRHADGGKFGSANADTTNSDTQAQMMLTLDNLTQAVNYLVDNGVVAYANIKQFNQQQTRLNSIIEDATFK